MKMLGQFLLRAKGDDSCWTLEIDVAFGSACYPVLNDCISISCYTKLANAWHEN